MSKKKQDYITTCNMLYSIVCYICKAGINVIRGGGEVGGRAYVGDLTFLRGKSFKLESQAKAPGWKYDKSLTYDQPRPLKHNIDTCIIKYTEYYNLYLCRLFFHVTCINVPYFDR